MDKKIEMIVYPVSVVVLSIAVSFSAASTAYIFGETLRLSEGEPCTCVTEVGVDTADVQAVPVVPQVMAQVVPTQDERKLVKLGEFRVTAYCPCGKCCGKWAYNRPTDERGDKIVMGASGARLIDGVSIAVDPSVIPYGSTVIMDGAEYIAHDCGGAIKGNSIDIYFDDHDSATEYALRYVDVYVVATLD